jgi:hypothetical protein
MASQHVWSHFRVCASPATNQPLASEWIFEDQLVVRICSRWAPNDRNRRHEITPLRHWSKSFLQEKDGCSYTKRSCFYFKLWHFLQRVNVRCFKMSLLANSTCSRLYQTAKTRMTKTNPCKHMADYPSQERNGNACISYINGKHRSIFHA